MKKINTLKKVIVNQTIKQMKCHLKKMKNQAVKPQIVVKTALLFKNSLLSNYNHKSSIYKNSSICPNSNCNNCKLNYKISKI